MSIVFPQTSSLKQILHGKRYAVPIYQRPYTWTIDEANELWSDIEKNNPPYFLGILVFEKTSDSAPLTVVDGQQRMATLLLLLRSAVVTLGEDDSSAQKIQNDYINQKEFGEEKSKFTLTLNKRDMYSFFTLLEGIKNFRPQVSTRVTKGRSYSSNKKLNDVYQLFKDKMTALREDAENDGIISFIQKVLKLHFVEIQLENDEDIYLFFESLNAKGIDLTVADTLKNRVCMVSDYPERASLSIDDITYILGEGRMNSFLLHYAIARSTTDKPPPKKDLMRWFGEVIKNEKDKFLVNLKEYAEPYAFFLDPRNNSYKNNIEIKRVLTNLKALGATRCYPLLLVGDEFLETKEFLKLCEAVEKLTFRHSTIVGQDAKALETVYYKLAQDIRNRRSLEKILDALDTQSKQIQDELFKFQFKKFIPGNNQIAKYILLKIQESLNKESIRLDWDDITLEHILPGGSNWEGKDEYLEWLGNKTLINGKLNTQLGNKEFKYKKDRYRAEKGFTLTQDLSNYEDFTKETIFERQEYLTRLSSDIWKTQNSD